MEPHLLFRSKFLLDGLMSSLSYTPHGLILSSAQEVQLFLLGGLIVVPVTPSALTYEMTDIVLLVYIYYIISYMYL